MDEILELQLQLAAAQKRNTAQKLSERNCVELVMKLQSLDLIDLIFTRTGKEYLTPEQLVVEIEDELMAHGGRVNVIDLPDILNVDLFHIQRKIPKVLEASSSSTRLVRGELLTDYYLTSVAEELNDFLTSSEHGIDSIGDIASRYSLPVEVVRDILQTHLHTTINASIDAADPDTLRSAASMARDRVAARGLLRATTTPVALVDLASVREIPSVVLVEVTASMLETGDLDGQVVGRGLHAIFVPTIFSSAAVQAASSAYASNGFIKLDWLERMHISDTSAFAANHVKDAIILQDCIVGPSLLETLANLAAEAISSGTWLDVEAGLPPGFPEGDVGAVMARLVASLPYAKNARPEDETKCGGGKVARLKRKAKQALGKAKRGAAADTHPVVYGDQFVVSPALAEVLSLKITNDAVEKANHRAEAMAEETAMVVAQAEATVTQQACPSPSEKSGKSKGKGRRRAAMKGKSAIEDMVGKSAEANGISGDGGFPIAIPSIEEALELIISDDGLSNIIETDYLGSSNAGEEMLTSVIETLYGEDGLSTLYRTKAEGAVVTLLKERAAVKQNAEKALLASLVDAELYEKSAASLPDDDLELASKAWIIDDICSAALCRIVHSVAQNTGVLQPSVAHAHNLSSKKERLEAIRGVAPKLAPTLEAAIRSLLAVVSDKEGGKVSHFLALYDENADILDLPTRRPLDKKSEKAGYANARVKLLALLDAENNLSETQSLEIAAVLLHANNSGGAIVVIPASEVGSLCRAVEEEARPAEAGEALQRLRKSLSNTEGGLSSDFSARLTVLRKYTG